MFARTRIAGSIVACSAVFLTPGCQSPPESRPNGVIRQQQYKSVASPRPQLASANEIDLQPGAIQSKTFIAAARLHESQGHLLPAIQQYQAALQEDPKNVEVMARIGLLYDQLGNGAAAEAAYKQALQIDPQDARLHNNLAFNYIMRRQWSLAEAELNDAIKLAPEFARARVNLAMTMAQQSRFDEALKQFEFVLPAEDAHYNMGLMYQSKRKMVEAAEQYKRALQVNPKLTAAAQQLKKMPSSVLSEADRRIADDRKTAKLAVALAAKHMPSDEQEARLVPIESTKARPVAATQPAAVQAARAGCAAVDQSALKIELAPLLSYIKAVAEACVPVKATPATRPAQQQQAAAPSHLPAVDVLSEADVKAGFSDALRNDYLGAGRASELDSLLPPWQRTPEVVAELAMDYSWIHSAGEGHWLDLAESPLPRIARHATRTKTFMTPSPSTQPH